jgi:aminoglycoside 3-N-acetyltransferase
MTDHPNLTLEKQLSSGLLALGVQPGGVLLVHSSMHSFGPSFSEENQGAEIVIQSLLSALGSGGTLLMPALSYDTVGPQNPYFDVRSTPTCVGALQEYFRKRPGTVRSVHPTHSVCGVGHRTAELLSDHQLDTTPCGPHSPFAKLPHVGGQVLFLGCGLGPNTAMHAIEEHVVPPYLFGDRVDYHVTLADGSETTMTVRGHNFKGWTQRYDRLEEVQKHGFHKAQILHTECYLLDASEMYLAALSALRTDPYFFVEKAQ